ncbi:unnamed protein product [Lupinus luteus]|uniref:FBD domain-containing protein n=1 Tax=Lupinus luteus TaxID=3873 RepID=A0AAV1W0T7_LUPLU
MAPSLVQPLNRFILSCARCSNSNITAWVGKAAQLKTEEIDITLSVSRYVVLPRRLFNCETVSVMKLNGVYLSALMSFSVSLPKLRVLHVGDSVLFGCHDYIFVLLAGCPVLEDLLLESSYTEACGGLVCAKGDFELDLKHLAKAKIGFSWRKICQKSIFMIFQALCNVRFLSITHSTTACLKYAIGSDIPVFNNLIQLEISFGNYHWDLLARLLQKSPRLEALIIHKEPQESTTRQESKWNPPHVPDCLLVHLKTFCLKECRGWESEMKLVGYIMQSARVLETIRICISSSIALEAQLQIRRNLSVLQRRFQSCLIVFH